MKGARDAGRGIAFAHERGSVLDAQELKFPCVGKGGEVFVVELDMEGASVWDAEFGFQEGEPAFCGFLFQNEVFVVGVVFQEVKDGTGGLEGVVGSAVIGHHAEHIVYVAHEAEELG